MRAAFSNPVLLFVFTILAMRSISFGEDRGAQIAEDLEGKKYRKQFAIIIGINYEAREVALTKSVPARLRNAENDATRLNTLLLRNFGYRPETVQLLLGVKATHQNLLDLLGEVEQGKWNGEAGAITPDDSILFFFSGHGQKLTLEENLALLPSDVHLDPESGIPTKSSRVEIHDLCNSLKKCRARHKLLVLDCCFSGAVFELKDESSVLPAPRPMEIVFERPNGQVEWPSPKFNTKSFQAIAASHSIQKAADGAGQNSPFTRSLLDALNTYSYDHNKSPFPVSALFGVLGRLFVANAPEGSRQYPQCRWLSQDSGEFFFFPEGEFERNPELDRLLQQQLIAMIPGVNGNWWFDESPWMLPSMREKILKNVPEERASSPDFLSIEMLRVAALNYLSQPEEPARIDLPVGPEAGHRHDLVKMRRAQLRHILEARDFDRVAVLQSIEAELRERIQVSKTGELETSLEAVDLHFLGVLSQGSGSVRDREQQKYVKAVYEHALTLYKSRDVLRNKPLITLCHMDYAWFLSEVCDDIGNALVELRKAGEQFENDGLPKPVKVFLLCREGDLLLVKGMWGAAAAKWKRAYEIVTEARQQQLPAPLVAWVIAKQGWGHLDQWKVDQANCLFGEANTVLEPLTSQRDDPAGVDYDAIIFQLHNLHGRAIALRYSGQSRAASQEYDRLIQRVSASRSAHARSDGGGSYGFAEVQARFNERLVNSLERRGDCGLFGDPQQLEQADDDYRLALRECARMKPADARRWRLRLLDKRALTLALSPVTSSIYDPGLSRSLLDQADEVSGRPVAESYTQLCEIDSSANPRLIGFLADCVLRANEQPVEGDGESGTLRRLRTVIRARSREGLVTNTIARDELESLMFGCRLLVQMGAAGAVDRDRADLLDDIGLLSNLCRLVQRGDDRGQTVNRQKVLRFLRPYYDAAIEASLAARGKHVRATLELISESIEGTSSIDGFVRELPRMSLYAMPNRTVILLDVPERVSKCYVVATGSLVEKLRLATSDQNRRIPFPREFLVDWEKLPVPIRRSLVSGIASSEAADAVAPTALILWRDPIRQIGSEEVVLEETTLRTIAAGADDVPTSVKDEDSRTRMARRAARFPLMLEDLNEGSDQPPTRLSDR